VYHRKRFWAGLLLILPVVPLAAHGEGAQPLPGEPEVRGENHRVTLTLVAHTAADGRSQFRSSAGSEPPS
jgi:hypothetical protein